MEKDVEVKIKQGVYLDITGRYFDIGFGFTDEMSLAIKVTGADENYEETSRIGRVDDEHFTISL